MTKILCPSLSGQNKCIYLKDGVCQADEIEMDWDIMGSILYYCATEDTGE